MVDAESLDAVHTHTHGQFIENESKQTKKVKEANIELLRILGMFMIIISHFMNYSGLIGKIDITIGINYFIISSLYLIVKMANSLFILTSGYFSVHSKFNISKIIKLWGKMFFFSIFIFAICTIMGKDGHPYESFLPMLSGQYWFTTAYIIMYFLSPIISILINKLTKNQFKYLIVISLIIFEFIGVMFDTASLWGGIITFLIVYFIGAYIRLHVDLKKEKQYYFLKFTIIFMIAMIFNVIFRVLLPYFYISNLDINIKLIIARLSNNIYNYSNILLIFAAIFLFMKFKTTEIKNIRISKIINFISLSVFSIYLMHDNVNSRAIWPMILNNIGNINSPLLVVYIILIALCVFSICLVIDLIRRGIIYSLKIIPITNKWLERLNEKLKHVNEKINNYLT